MKTKKIVFLSILSPIIAVALIVVLLFTFRTNINDIRAISKFNHSKQLLSEYKDDILNGKIEEKKKDYLLEEWAEDDEKRNIKYYAISYELAKMGTCEIEKNNNCIAFSNNDIITNCYYGYLYSFDGKPSDISMAVYEFNKNDNFKEIKNNIYVKGNSDLENKAKDYYVLKSLGDNWYYFKYYSKLEQ